MAEERTPDQEQDDRRYEPPRLVVLGTVRQLTSEGDLSESQK
jgi:hypothetical protein